MIQFNWKKIRKILIILIVFSIGWCIFNQRVIRQEKQFKVFLKTVRRPDGDYLKIILLPINKLPIEKMSLVTPNDEMIELDIDNFKGRWPMRALVLKELKLNGIPPGLCYLKVYCKNNIILTRRVRFIPYYVNSPKNLEVKDSIVSWDFDDSILASVIEIREINGEVVWESDYLSNTTYYNIYCLDVRRLKDGKEYKIRIKSYDLALDALPTFARVYSNENISDFKRFYYRRSSLQLISWQVKNIAFKDFISTQKTIYKIKVYISNPWAIKKIICIGPEGKNYKLYRDRSYQSYSAHAHKLKDGIYTLKIYPAKGRLIIVKKQFLFDRKHDFPNKISYKDRKISWQGGVEVDSYRVLIYGEYKGGFLFLKKWSREIAGNSVLLKEKDFVEGMDYCFTVIAFKEIHDGESVNESFSPLYYFTFY